MEVPLDAPTAFLGDMFEPGVEPSVGAGYHYSPSQKTVLGGDLPHQAIDYDLPPNTLVFAPAAGWAVCTFGEARQLLPDGTPYMMSPREALERDPSLRHIQPPDGADPDEPLPVFFGSYAAQIWHPDNGLYTQFAHFNWVPKSVPYYSFTFTDTGDRAYSQVLRAPVESYQPGSVKWHQSGLAKWVNAGDLIGITGMTGCGWGRPSIEFAAICPDGRPDFRLADYPYWTDPHLHHMVLGARDETPLAESGYLGDVTVFYDPHARYSDNPADYPTARSQWHRTPPGAPHHSLWLPQTSTRA